MVAGILPIIGRFSFTIKSLEKEELAIGQQRHEIAELITAIVDIARIRSIEDEDEFEDLSPNYLYMRNIGDSGWWVNLVYIELHMSDTGSWVPTEIAKLSTADQGHAFRVVAAFCVDLVIGLGKVKAERGSDNNSSDEREPASLSRGDISDEDKLVHPRCLRSFPESLRKALD